jgi:hypothetical protein
MTGLVIARSASDEAIQGGLIERWIASLSLDSAYAVAMVDGVVELSNCACISINCSSRLL